MTQTKARGKMQPPGSPNSIRRVVIAALAVILAATTIPYAHAQSVHEEVRPSLVYLKATGIGAAGQTMGVKQELYATGFLVSEEGFVLTVYHLLAKLGDVRPETIEVVGNLKEKSAQLPLRLWVIDANPSLDLLLLKLSPRAERFQKLALGRADAVGAADPIHTSGFPKSIDYMARDGKILVRDGPGGNVWATDLNLEEGQSGSPVYDGQGNVIGIAKASATANSGTNFFIPIEFADSLLVQLRMLDIQKRLGNLMDHPADADPETLAQRIRTIEEDIMTLRQHFNWSAKIENTTGGRVLRISYEKMMAGEPYPAELGIKIQPTGQKDGKPVQLTVLDGFTVQPAGSATRSSGSFDVVVSDRLNPLLDVYQLEKLDLRVDILPKQADGTDLRPGSANTAYEVQP